MSCGKVILVPIGGIAGGRHPCMLQTLLGSCVGMIVQDLRRQIAVLAHVVRPHGNGAGMGPGYFANLAAPRARDLAIQSGAGPGELLVRIAGGGRMLDGVGDIGEQNVKAITEATYALGMTFGGRLRGATDGGCLVAVDAGSGRALVRGIGEGVLDEAAWSRLRSDLEDE
ncbi:MAG: chemotaxis protein CheD [Planctomycetota bacterium]